MPEADSNIRKPLLQQVLLGYLEVGPTLFWPGGDGLTLDHVLLSYGPAAATGRVPDLEELLTRYPELAHDLKTFFLRQGWRE
jgi:hypothetical protein